MVAGPADRATRRWQQARASGTVTLSDGAVADVPSVSSAILKSPSLVPFLNPDSDGGSRRTGATSADPATPTHAGDEPGAPPPRRPSSESGAARREGVEAF